MQSEPQIEKGIPLEVEWLCRSHHLQAHGRGNGPQPKRLKHNWLDKVKPSNEHYDAPKIVTAIKDFVYKPRVKTICADTGLRYDQVKAVLSGERVTNRVLITMLRYVETLKQQKVA